MKWDIWPRIRNDLHAIGAKHWKKVLSMLEQETPNVPADKDDIPWKMCQDTVLALEELYKEHEQWTPHQQRAFETLMYKIQNTHVINNHFASTVEKCSPKTLEWMLTYNCRPQEYLIPIRSIGYYVIREMVRSDAVARHIRNFGAHEDDPIDSHFINTTTEEEWKVLVNDRFFGKMFTNGLLLSTKGRAVVARHLDRQNIDVKNVHDFKNYYDTYGPMRWLGIYVFEHANYQNFDMDRYIRYLEGALDDDKKQDFYRACTVCKELLNYLQIKPITVLDVLPQEEDWTAKVRSMIHVLQPRNEKEAMNLIETMMDIHPVSELPTTTLKY